MSVASDATLDVSSIPVKKEVNLRSDLDWEISQLLAQLESDARAEHDPDSQANTAVFDILALISSRREVALSSIDRSVRLSPECEDHIFP